MHRSVLIYQDYVHNNGLLYRALRDYFGHADYCDAGDIKSGVLNDDVRLFVMPGGADLYYCEKLNGAGNDAIRQYVESGGRYLGICAGAYYACHDIEWAKGTGQDICGPRELAFYEGTATGPLYHLMQDIDGSWLGAADIVYDGAATAVSYAAGPYFSEPADNTAVLARYSTGEPAIIELAVGKGRAILSGLHIERIMPHAEVIFYKHRNASADYEQAIFAKLARHTEGQKKIWNGVLSRLAGSS